MLPQRLQKLGCNRVARFYFIRERDRDDRELKVGLLRTAHRALAHDACDVRVMRPSRTHCRTRLWVRLSPGCARSCCKSSGLSTSSAMPGNSSTMQGFPVAWAAARGGLKMSLPKG